VGSTRVSRAASRFELHRALERMWRSVPSCHSFQKHATGGRAHMARAYCRDQLQSPKQGEMTNASFATAVYGVLSWATWVYLCSCAWCHIVRASVSHCLQSGSNRLWMRMQYQYRIENQATETHMPNPDMPNPAILIYGGYIGSLCRLSINLTSSDFKLRIRPCPIQKNSRKCT
jgi:hypothetical protein